MVPLFLSSVLAVALPPFGLVFAAHELVKLVVVSLSFPLFVFPTVILVSLSAAVLLPLLLVTLRLPSSGQSGDGIDTTELLHTVVVIIRILDIILQQCVCFFLPLNIDVNSHLKLFYP